MSSLIGANTAYPAGQITFMPEGEGERAYDAISADVIAKGLIVWLDSENATPGLRAYKLPGTAGAERGPYKLVTKDKAAGVAKLVGVGKGFEGTVTAGAAIPGGARVRPSAVTAGRVDAMLAADNAGLAVGEYVRKAKYSNSGDGNNAVGAAVAGDVIVVKFY
jgi:hypothetical protein